MQAKWKAALIWLVLAVAGFYLINELIVVGVINAFIETWIIHLGIGDMKSHLAGLKATFGSLRILTERRSW